MTAQIASKNRLEAATALSVDFGCICRSEIAGLIDGFTASFFNGENFD